MGQGIEPSDVTDNVWKWDNIPGPIPEPHDSDRGRPSLSGLGRNPDDPIFCTIGQSVPIRMTVKGEKNIKVTMFEKMFDQNETKREVYVVPIRRGDAGFQITIRCQRESMVGQHDLVFEATNRLGTAILNYYLVIQGRNNGG